ncbi:MAG: ATP-binding protein [Chitinivibrionales bacterium]|nr:ATP-binding protein [Chitinivibrionales bacterium]
MKRMIDSTLDRWKTSDYRKPLIIRGARQVGKTYSIRDFGERAFTRFVHCDFEEMRGIHSVFEGDLSAKKIIMQLEAFFNCRIIPGETLLFFDEIQKCPAALMSMRYFYEQTAQLHLIAAGSLLEFALETVSFPVGRVDFAWMYPMTFSEFLVANNQTILSQHLPNLTATEELPRSIHEKLLEQLRIFCIVGGMPEAVARFIKSGSFAECAQVHRSLIQAFRDDLLKYHTTVDTACLERVYLQIPRLVGKQIKYTTLDPDSRSSKVKDALQVLERCQIATKVQSASGQGLPLGADASQKIFKLIFIDIGLMQHLCGIAPIEILNNAELLDVYQGALTEQFIGQELRAANSCGHHGLFYWSRTAKSSTAEVDYLFELGSSIIPIEVKSGAAGRFKSLWMYLQEHPLTPFGYVISSSNIKIDTVHKLTFLPLYVVFKNDVMLRE